MSERSTLFRLERDGIVATIVLENPAKLNAWAMARKEYAHFEGK